MRTDYLFRFLSSIALSFAIAAGNVFCIVTAFHIPVETVTLAAICFFFAFVFSALFITDRTHIVPTIAVALGALAFIVVYRHEIKYGFEAAKNTMLAMYSESYGWIFDIDELYVNAEATYFFAIIGAVVALAASWTVSRQDGIFAIGAISGGLLSPCLMIIQSPPSAAALLMLVCAYVVMLLTQTGRRYSKSGQFSSVWGMLLPSVLTVAVVYFIVLAHPATGSEVIGRMRDTFKEQAERHALFRQDVDSGEFKFVNPTGSPTLGEYKWNERLDEVDLSSLSGQRSSRQRVMQVYSDREGTLYLRGNSFQAYEDNTWRETSEDLYSQTAVPESVWSRGADYFKPVYQYSGYYDDGSGVVDIQIKTDIQSRIMYLPFVPGGIPEGGVMHYDEYVLNPDRLTEYTAPYGWFAFTTGTSEDYERLVYNIYRQMPDETRRTIDGLFTDNDVLYQYKEAGAKDELVEYYGENIAYLVSQYVVNLARYDLSTPAVPEGEDFVSWFLTESETGYCVHYASAAVMLLRYFNIPARYVNGYVAETRAGQWVDVTQNDAHAWVEFYSRGRGWCLLEVTPEIGDGSIRAETEEEEEEPDYTPPDEQEPTPPSEPTETEQPAEQEQTENGTIQRIKVPKWLWYSVGFVIFWALWNVTIRQARKRYLNSGGRNLRTVKQYRRIVRLSKIIGEKVPEDVSEIAMKARFSQHKVTIDELNAVVERAERLAYRVHTLNNPFLRFVYTYVLCI